LLKRSSRADNPTEGIREKFPSAELAASHDASGRPFGHFLPLAMVALLSGQSMTNREQAGPTGFDVFVAGLSSDEKNSHFDFISCKAFRLQVAVEALKVAPENIDSALSSIFANRWMS
jgi:hypothetical protein